MQLLMLSSKMLHVFKIVIIINAQIFNDSDYRCEQGMSPVSGCRLYSDVVAGRKRDDPVSTIVFVL